MNSCWPRGKPNLSSLLNNHYLYPTLLFFLSFTTYQTTHIMKLTSIFLVALSMIFINCSKEDVQIRESKDDDSKSNIIYENNFENSDDIKGFEGMGELVESDFSETGGKSCFRISGGCDVPHVTFKIKMKSTNTITAKLLAKSEYNYCGEVRINLEGHDKSMEIELGPTEWESIKSNSALNVGEGDVLIVTIRSGGFLGCTSLIDNFVLESI